MDKPTIIASGALLISVVSIILSILNYRKDRWKLSLEAWIRIQTMSQPTKEQSRRGWLCVKAANIGRRALTIEKIYLQVFGDEIEELRKTPLVEMGRIDRIGMVACFRLYTPAGFPIQLNENEPITAEAPLARGDPAKLESRSRQCVVSVTGRRKPIKIRCGLPGDSGERKVHHFSGS